MCSIIDSLASLCGYRWNILLINIARTSLVNSLGPAIMHANVTNLGVISDSEWKFDKHINVVVINSFFQMKAIAKLKSVLWVILC